MEWPRPPPRPRSKPGRVRGAPGVLTASGARGDTIPWFAMEPHRPKPRLSAAQRLALLESLLDRVPDFFYVHDAELRFQYANRAAAEYFGRTKEDIAGLRHRDVDEAEQARFYEQALIPIIRRGDPVTTDDLPYRRRDGSSGLLQAHIVPFDDPNTGERMMLGISRDVTDERQVAAERAARAAYERELDIARRVQQSLLPDRIPSVASFDIAARCEPAAFVGGDFYDVIEADDDRFVVLIGDVTGHGVGSALIAAACRSFARVIFARSRIADGLAELDQALYRDLSDGSFATLAAVEIDAGRGSIRYVSAGHGPLFVVGADGIVETLPTHAPPVGLGAAPGDIDATELALSGGMALVLPSDGLFESQDPSGTQLGIARLAAGLAGTGSAAEACACCFATESRWRGDVPAADDRTAVVIRSG